jgi:uncharacterized membrane protein YhaH (DUF805 family)
MPWSLVTTKLTDSNSSGLIVLSIASFFPQIRKLRKQWHGRGISLPYVLFNLIVATEQLTIFLLFFILGKILTELYTIHHQLETA